MTAPVATLGCVGLHAAAVHRPAVLIVPLSPYCELQLRMHTIIGEQGLRKSVSLV